MDSGRADERTSGRDQSTVRFGGRTRSSKGKDVDERTPPLHGGGAAPEGEARRTPEISTSMRRARSQSNICVKGNLGERSASEVRASHLPQSSRFCCTLRASLRVQRVRAQHVLCGLKIARRGCTNAVCISQRRGVCSRRPLILSSQTALSGSSSYSTATEQSGWRRCMEMPSIPAYATFHC